MNYFNKVANIVSRRLVDAGRTRARQDLLARSDRFLADNGFLRELLDAGNSAWPWRIDDGVSDNSPHYAVPPAGLRSPVPAELLRVDNAYASAENELHALTDAELNDLGIARVAIAEVVRHGRPGIDRPASKTLDRHAA